MYLIYLFAEKNVIYYNLTQPAAGGAAETMLLTKTNEKKCLIFIKRYVIIESIKIKRRN